MTAQSLAKNTTFLYLRMIIVLGISLFTTRLILMNLGIENYGIYNVVGSIVSLLTFLQTAISSANYRYLAFAIGKGDVKLLSTTFKSALILGVIISIIVIILSQTIGNFYIHQYLNISEERFDAAYYTFQLSVLTCVVTTLYMPFYSNVISHERMDFFAYLSIFEAISKVVIAVSIIHSPIDKLVFYAFLLFITQICILIAYIVFSYKQFPEIKMVFHVKTNCVLLKKMASFSGWTLFVTVADLCAIQGINIILNLFFNPVVNAARGIAIHVQGAVDQFRGNLQTAFNPQITKRYASGQIEGMFNLMECSARYSSYILLIISLPIIFAVDNILQIWLNEVPQYTNVFVVFTLIASIIDGISNPFVTAISATGDIKKFQIMVGLIKFLTLPFCYIGGYYVGNPTVIFIIFLFITGLTVYVRIKICINKIHIPLNLIVQKIISPITKFSIIGIVVSAFLREFIQPVSLTSLLLFICFTVFSLIMSCFFFALNKSEKSTIVNFVKSKIK